MRHLIQDIQHFTYHSPFQDQLQVPRTVAEEVAEGKNSIEGSVVVLVFREYQEARHALDNRLHNVFGSE